MLYKQKVVFLFTWEWRHKDEVLSGIKMDSRVMSYSFLLGGAFPVTRPQQPNEMSFNTPSSTALVTLQNICLDNVYVGQASLHLRFCG